MKSFSRMVARAAAAVAVALGALAVQAAAEGKEVSFREVSFTVYKVDLERDRLELVSRRSNGVRIRNAGGLETLARGSGRRLLFATNSGIFGSSFEPLGLYVENGREIAPLNTGAGSGNFYLEPNGVFFVSGGRADVVPTASFDSRRHVEIASQSGPLLLREGRINALFDPNSSNKLIRSGVGVSEPSKVFFVISNDPVSFFDFASLFRDLLGCRSALYLDGVISALYADDIGRRQTGGDFAGMFAVFERLER